VHTGKPSLIISVKPVGVGVALQLWIAKGERSRLLTRTATTENVSLGERIKLASFLEVESAIREALGLNNKDNDYRFSYLG